MMDKIHITTKRKIQVVSYKDIVYMEKFGRKIRIHLFDNEIDFYGKFSDLMPLLDGRFTNPHESYLFNMDYISSIDDQGIEIMDITRINMGRKCLCRARKDYNKYIIGVKGKRDNSPSNKGK